MSQAKSFTHRPYSFQILSLCFLLLSSLESLLYAQTDPSYFVTTWKTDNVGTSGSTSISIPINSDFTYSYDVDWDGDGIFDERGITGEITHDYGTAGIYTVQIRGTFPGIYFNNGGDKKKILTVAQWGAVVWGGMKSAFNGCTSLTIPAMDAPDFSNVTDMSYMFAFASLANPDVSGWDVSSVTDMSYMYAFASLANPDVSSWDVSSVTSMQEMFSYTPVANPDVSGWDVSNVTDMSYMFSRASVADPDVTYWDVSNVMDMSYMFSRASVADPDVSKWDVSGVIDMVGMFTHTLVANPDVRDWDVSSVTDMSATFNHARVANPDVSKWDVSNVTNMFYMFSDTRVANPDVSYWDVSKVRNMSYMFLDASLANPNVRNWDVSSVTDMYAMFSGASLANPDVSYWDVSKVRNMIHMFSFAPVANPDVSKWDVSSVTNMTQMFDEAIFANPDMSGWDVSSVAVMRDFTSNSNISLENYEAALLNFAGQTLQFGVLLDISASYCSSEALTARTSIISTYGWTINDLGENCVPINFLLSSNVVAENSVVGTSVGMLSATDPEGAPLTYSLVNGTGDTDNTLFTLAGDELQVNGSLDYETKQDYSIRINMNDGVNDYAEIFIVEVTDVNETPTAMILGNSIVFRVEVRMPPHFVGILTTEDADHLDEHTYTLVSGDGDSDNSKFDVDNANDNLLLTDITGIAGISSYSVRLRTTDVSGLFFEQPLMISVSESNSAPTLIDLSSSEIPENSPIGTLVGTLTAMDVDAGNQHFFSLESGIGDTDNGAFTLNSEAGTLSANEVFDYETKQNYSVRINVNDGVHDYAQVFTITVSDVNEVPTALTLSANMAAENTSIGAGVGILTATDVDAGNQHFFSMVRGTGDTDNVLFRAVGNVLEVKGILDYEVKQIYSIRVNVNDGVNDYVQVFTITVSDVDEVPTALSLSANVVAENSVIGTAVGMLSATDPEDAPLTYSLVNGMGGTDNTLFTISGDELQVNGVIDYETKIDYSVRINVNDGANDYAQLFTITVSDVNEVPAGLSLSANVVAENTPIGTVVGVLSATDPESVPLTYSLVSGTGDTDNALFTIVDDELQVNGVLDYEMKTDYSVRVNVADGVNDYSQMFTITVSDVNDEAPTALFLSANVVAENSVVGTVVGTLSVTDVDASNTFTYSLVSGSGDTDNSAFTLNPQAGTLSANGVLDYETKQDYSVRINVNDGVHDYAQELTIMVADENEAPTSLALSANAVAENRAVGTVVGSLTTTDIDASNTFIYSLVSGTGDTDNALFTIAGGELQVNGVLDYETKQDYSVRINVNDGANDVAQVFTISVTDVNETPTDIALSNTTLLQNSTNGTLVGEFTAVDVDAGSTHTFSLVSGQGDASFFSISTSSQLVLTDASDIGSRTSYTILVEVNDGSNTFEKSVVLDVNPLGLELPRGFAVYPNPVSHDGLRVELGDALTERVSVEVLDVLGRRQFVEEYASTSTLLIPTASLVRGLYVLRVLDAAGETLLTTRFVKR